MGKVKRTVWFGNPVIVVRRAVVFAALYTLIFIGGWKLFVLLLSVEVVGDFVIDRFWIFILVITVFAAGSMVFVWFFTSRFIDPMVRLQKLNGRMCYVCGYEIVEGLEMCSECGARWSLDDLNRGWRKMAGLDR